MQSCINENRKVTKMTDKQIMIDGVNVAGCVRLQDDEISCDLGGECKGWRNCYYKQLARKTQECEQLEDFRTLTREVFTFGDSDVDDENFIKYLQEYSRSYEEAIDGYYRLTDITGIDYTVHGGADIEEIIKRVDILKQECEELKKEKENEIQNTVEMERLAKSYGQDLMIYKQNKDIEVNSLKDDILFYLKLIKKIETYCNQQNLKYDTTACEILEIINKAKDGE